MTRLTNDNRSRVKEHVNADGTIRQNWLFPGNDPHEGDGLKTSA
jgi:hypothetical protein